MRRKPSNNLKATTHPASDEDYNLLANAVISAIINKRRDVVIRFPYFVSLPDDFPKGVLYKKDEMYNYYRAKAFKVMDWLYEHGHSSQDAKAVVKSLRSVVNLLGEIDRMVANPEASVYNVCSELKEDV